MDMLDGINDLILDVEGGFDLHSYAAVAALRELEKNWRSAIHDGAALEDLIKDVPQVIERLENFKRRAEHYASTVKEGA